MLGIWGETLDQNGVVYGYACQTEASSTRCPLFSLFKIEIETKMNLLNSRFSPFLHGFLLQTSPRTKSTPLKHSNFLNVTHSLAPVDTTAQGSKKQSSKEKGELTFPFSFVIFNFLWVDTMLAILWNILTLVEEFAKCGQS